MYCVLKFKQNSKYLQTQFSFKVRFRDEAQSSSSSGKITGAAPAACLGTVFYMDRGSNTLGHYKEKRSEHYNDIRWLSSFSILLQKLNHILLLQCNEKTELFVLSCVVTICSRGHSCLSGFISNIVNMPLTQCHISHWYTVLALFFTRSPHYSCSFCHVTISKKKNFS